MQPCFRQTGFLPVVGMSKRLHQRDRRLAWERMMSQRQTILRHYLQMSAPVALPLLIQTVLLLRRSSMPVAGMPRTDWSPWTNFAVESDRQ